MRCDWLLAALTLNLAAIALADGPAPAFSIVSPKDEGIIAADINDRGEVVGFEWVEEKGQPDILSQKPFLARGGAITYLPLLAGYSATFPAAISDDGLVVGRASKPARPGVRVTMRNQAFAWDERAGIRGLGTLDGDRASFACGVSRDGRRISGYSVGQDRTTACYWDRLGDGWQAIPLTQGSGLSSITVAISDDGNSLAAVVGGACCLWTERPAGFWKREEVAPAGDILPRAVNNDGTIAGVRSDREGNDRAVVWTRARGLRTIDLPAGYARSEANALNNAGVVVGMIDGPRGSKTGPRGFAFDRGELHILGHGALPLVSAAAINDRGQVAGTLEKDEDIPEPDAQGKPVAAPDR